MKSDSPRKKLTTSGKSAKSSGSRAEITPTDPLFQVLKITETKNQIFAKWKDMNYINPFSISVIKNYQLAFYQGWRIYTPSDIRLHKKSMDKKPIMILDRNNKTSYIVLSDVQKKQIKNYTISDFCYWKGIRYTKNQQIYVGQFKYLNKLCKNGQALEIKRIPKGSTFELFEVCSQELQKIEGDLYCIFKGQYFENKRQANPEKKYTPTQHTHTHTEQQNRSVYQLKKNQNQNQYAFQPTIVNYYDIKGQIRFSLLDPQYKGGTLNCSAVISCFDRDTRVLKKGFFINSYFSQGKKGNGQRQDSANFEITYPSYLGLTISQKIVKTLDPREWLNPNILAYFLRRVEFTSLSKSFSLKKKNFFVQPVNFLQSLKSRDLSKSNIDQAYAKIDVNWSSYRHMNLFPFELFGLLLIPYNRDKSHFALAAVQVETTLDQKNQLSNAEITIFDLDSIYKDKLGQQRLREFIGREIEFIKIQNQKNIYKQALKRAKTLNIYNLGYPSQINGYDCGLYVCIYGFFLYKRYVCDQNISQLIKMPQRHLKHMRQFLKRVIVTQEGNFVEKVQNIILYGKEESSSMDIESKGMRTSGKRYH